MLTELQIFAKRLKQARIQKKLSMEQLANLMDGIVSKQAISKYESAKMMPNMTVLVSIAEVLNVELDDLFRPFNFEVENLQVSFRKKSDAGAKEINSLKIKIQDDIEKYLEIENILEKQTPEFAQVNSEILSSPQQMWKCAREIREQWKLGNDAIANVQDMLEEHGIKVILTEASPNFDGVSGVVNNKYYFVVLNREQKHIERRRFTTLHELGHLLFNDRFDSRLTQHEKESLCDNFANEMLIPTSAIESAFKPGDQITTSELKELQYKYGVSINAIMVKIHQLEIMNDNRYKSYCIRKRNDERLRNFIEKTRYKENLTNRFETMVYSAAAKELISTSKAASLLKCSVSNVRKNLNTL